MAEPANQGPPKGARNDLAETAPVVVKPVGRVVDVYPRGLVLGGKYRIERLLGEGGIGFVLAATHLQFDTLVAIKLLRPEVIKEAPEVMIRLITEARSVVRLKSEHVARVMDVGTLDTGEPFLVMEYLDGQDLSSMLRQRGALPVMTAVSFMLQICDGVAAAHAQGIIHRDLKPANLFVTTGADGMPCVKVLDFGIAKAASLGGFNVTRTLTMIGTPLYMSPEQMRNSKDVDARADVWSLGVILHQMLTGEVPFRGGSTVDLVMSVSNDPLPPLRRADVSLDLWAVVRGCLEKEPAERLPSVGALARSLAPFADDDGAKLAIRVSRVLGESESAQPSLLASAHSSSKRASAGRVVIAASEQSLSADPSSIETMPAPPMPTSNARLVVGVVAALISLVAIVVIVSLVQGRRQANDGAKPIAGFGVSVQGSASGHPIENATSATTSEPVLAVSAPLPVSDPAASSAVSGSSKPREPSSGGPKTPNKPPRSEQNANPSFGDRQ